MNEAFNVGKGGNAVISMLHHYFHHHDVGETTAHLHAENNNRYMMSYLMLCVLTGLHNKIMISFLPVRHTKFVFDWWFGLFKQHLCWIKINTLHNIAAAVDSSSMVNVPDTRWTMLCANLQLE